MIVTVVPPSDGPWPATDPIDGAVPTVAVVTGSSAGREGTALTVGVDDDDVGGADDAGRDGHEDARGADDRDRRARRVVREAGRSIRRPEQDVGARQEMSAGEGDVRPAVTGPEVGGETLVTVGAGM